MASFFLPSKVTQQPTEYAQLANSSSIRKPVAAFVPSGTGVRIFGEGKHDLSGKSTGPGVVPSQGVYGLSLKGTVSNNTVRLNALANQFDTVWEKPSTQVTVMLVFKRMGTPAGTSPIFSNQCPNNDPFCAWGLFDQTTDLAGFETSSGNINKRINSNIVIPNNQMVVLIGRYDGAKMELFQNGVKVGSLAATGSLVYPNVGDRGPSVGNFYNFTGSNRSAVMEVYGGALWDIGINDAEVNLLSQNPWQLFASPTRRLWTALSGNILTYSYTSVGGVLLSGSSQKARGKVYGTTGGVVLSGATNASRGVSRLPTGGLSLAGSATSITSTLKSLVVQGVGGLLLSGTSTLRRQITASASGGGIFFAGTGGAKGYIAGDIAVLMGAINDVVFQSLRRMGRVGSRNDMLNENIYWRALANNNQILSLNDVKKLVLRNLGYSGALNNMEKQYWSER